MVRHSPGARIPIPLAFQGRLTLTFVGSGSTKAQGLDLSMALT